MLAAIHVVAKPGRAKAINAHYKTELGQGFLIWTCDRIAARIRAVNAGEVEALAHLRGRLESIADWNRKLPEMAEGCGSVLIAEDEATLTPVQLVSLRRSVLFIEKHRGEFVSVEGLEVARMLLGGTGRQGIAVPVPSVPSEIYRLCARYKALDLWSRYYHFRNDPSKEAWAALKRRPVPWHHDRTVESLLRLAPNYSPTEEFPSAIALRRALLPADPPAATKGAGVPQIRKLPPREKK